MKKSQLRNIIKQVIREQLDVEKNKLRPIKPEPIEPKPIKLKPLIKPPKGGGSSNHMSHANISIEVCGVGTSDAQVGWTYNLHNYGGFNCDGQLCGSSNIGQSFTAVGPTFGVYEGAIIILTAYSLPSVFPAINNMIPTSCPVVVIDNCMDPNALNYDPNASINDCVCTYGSPQEGVIQPGGSNNKCADPNANNYASNANYDCNGCYLTTMGDGSSGPMSAGWDSCCTYGEIEYGYQCSNVGPCAMRSLDPNHPLAYDPFNPQYGAMSSFPYVNPCGQGQQSDPGCYYGGGSSMQNLNNATEACTAIAISNGWDMQDLTTYYSQGSCPNIGSDPGSPWIHPYDGINVHPL